MSFGLRGRDISSREPVVCRHAVEVRAIESKMASARCMISSPQGDEAKER